MRSTLDLNKAGNKLKATLGTTAYSSSARMEAYAKANRRWTDRTGAARASIKGDWGWEKDKLVMSVSGNTDYFQYLELSHQLRYSILKPTVMQLTPGILSAMQKLVK